MALNDLTCSKVNHGYAIISREGRFGTSTFFNIQSKTEALLIISQLNQLVKSDTNT